jgi:hypothetical protein
MSNSHFAICILQFAFCTVSAVRADLPSAVPVDGAPFRAELVRVAADGQITFVVGLRRQEKVMPLGDLVRWGQCPEPSMTGGLVTVDGGLLTADVASADRDRLTADSDLFGEMHWPLESLAGIVFHPSSDPQRRDAVLDRLVRATGRTDRLLLDNGDEQAGLFEGIAGDTVTLKTDAGPMAVKIERIAAILWNPSLRRGPDSDAGARKSPPRTWVGFRDGSRLPTSRLTVDGEVVKIAAAGQLLTASRASLVFVQPLGGRVTYLSDLAPLEYRQTPYLDLPWPYQADRNATGGMLRCGGRLSLKGIGVHSAARLVYALAPGTVRFESRLGIDDSTAGRGSVRFRVFVDGRERFASPILRGGDSPLPVAIKLRGAKRLELAVDYADEADVLDHADWLDARVVK